MPRAYVGDRQDRPLAVVFDPKGRLQFSKNGLPTGEHVVAVLDPKIDEAHLARLRRAGVSYVFQGDGAECTEREKTFGSACRARRNLWREAAAS